MKWIAFIEGIALLICITGWLNRWVICAALIKSMEDKNTLPSDDEMKACLTWVWKKLLHID